MIGNDRCCYQARATANDPHIFAVWSTVRSTFVTFPYDRNYMCSRLFSMIKGSLSTAWKQSQGCYIWHRHNARAKPLHSQLNISFRSALNWFAYFTREPYLVESPVNLDILTQNQFVRSTLFQLIKYNCHIIQYQTLDTVRIRVSRWPVHRRERQHSLVFSLLLPG